MDLDTQANPLDVAFTDSRHGYLVGSNRMIRETNDGGVPIGMSAALICPMKRTSV